MLAGWKELKLGDLCALRAGSAFKTRYQGNAEGEYPFIKVSDMNLAENQFRIHRANNWIDEDVRAEIRAKPFPEGTTVFAKIGEALKQNRVRYIVRQTIVDNNMMGAIPNPEVVDPLFFFYRLSAFDFASTATGTALPYLTAKTLSESRVLVPPLPVQRRIAGALSVYDELIENSQRRIQILQAMARAVYREWFVELRFPGHEEHVRAPSPLGAVPEGWEVKTLDALVSSHIGGGWGKDPTDAKHTEAASVIRGTDIPDARNCQVEGVPHRYHTPSNLRSRRLESGDIVFEVSGGSKGQPLGRSLLITPELLSSFPGDVICASFCKRVQPDTTNYGSELLYLSFVEAYDSGEIEQFQVQSTGISNFKWKDYLSQTHRVVPPAPLRQRFREIVGSLLTQAVKLGLQIQNLRRTRELLLPRLLSGQLELKVA